MAIKETAKDRRERQETERRDAWKLRARKREEAKLPKVYDVPEMYDFQLTYETGVAITRGTLVSYLDYYSNDIPHYRFLSCVTRDAVINGVLNDQDFTHVFYYMPLGFGPMKIFRGKFVDGNFFGEANEVQPDKEKFSFHYKAEFQDLRLVPPKENVNYQKIVHYIKRDIVLMCLEEKNYTGTYANKNYFFRTSTLLERVARCASQNQRLRTPRNVIDREAKPEVVEPFVLTKRPYLFNQGGITVNGKAVGTPLIKL